MSKIINYADYVPFWIRIDIGEGKRWELAFLREDEDEERRMIVFPMADHDDFWDAERFSKYEQRPVLRPDQIEDIEDTLVLIARDPDGRVDAATEAEELLENLYLGNERRDDE